MNTFLRNTISKLYNAVSAPVAAIRDALAERLQGVRETTSLLYNMMMENMGYGKTSWKKKQKSNSKNQQQQKKKKKPKSNNKNQQQPKNNNRMMVI